MRHVLEYVRMDSKPGSVGKMNVLKSPIEVSAQKEWVADFSTSMLQESTTIRNQQ